MASSSGGSELEDVKRKMDKVEAKIDKLETDLEGLKPENPGWLAVQQRLAALQEEKVLLMRVAGGVAQSSAQAGLKRGADDMSADMDAAAERAVKRFQQLQLSTPGPLENSTPSLCRKLLSVPTGFKLPQTLLEFKEYFAAEVSTDNRLPLPPLLYAKLAHDGKEALEKMACLCTDAGAESLTSVLCAAFQFTSSEGATKLDVSNFILGILVGGFLEMICRESGMDRLASLTHNCGGRDPSGATAGSGRHARMPDMMFWLVNCLVFKSEFKSNKHSETVAEFELGTKMTVPWTLLTSGALPWLLCVGTAGVKLRFYAVMRDHCLAHALHDYPFDISQAKGRLQTLSTMASVARLLPLLHPACQGAKLKLGAVIPHTNGTSITILADSVRKKVEGFSWRTNTNHDFAALVQIYSDVEKIDGLIHAVRPPTLNAEEDVYSVNLHPLGYCHTVEGELQFKQQLSEVLRALANFHDLGYVHKDLRSVNILRDRQGHYFISDLEGAGRAERPDTGCSGHDPELLVEGQYTKVSDLKMLGRLFSNLVVLSAAGTSLGDRLRRGRRVGLHMTWRLFGCVLLLVRQGAVKEIERSTWATGTYPGLLRCPMSMPWLQSALSPGSVLSRICAVHAVARSNACS